MPACSPTEVRPLQFLGIFFIDSVTIDLLVYVTGMKAFEWPEFSDLPALLLDFWSCF